MCNLVMYVIIIHIRKQADSVVQVKTVLLTPAFGSSTRGERHNSYYANPTQYAAHLVIIKISIGRDPKNLTATATVENSTLCLNGRNLTTSSMAHSHFSTDPFQNPQILWTISSRHNVIHTPASFPVWGLL